MKFDRETFLKNLESEEDVIVLRNVYGNTGQTVEIYPTKDTGGRYMGIIENPTREQLESGQMRFTLTKKSSSKVKNGTSFNLKDEHDKAYWDMIKHSPVIAYSFEEAQYSPSAMFYIYIESKVSKEAVSKEKRVHAAKSLIFDDSLDNLITRARVIGIDLNGDTLEAVQQIFLEMAMKTPEKIEQLYSANIATNILFYKALDNNIIFKGKDDLYRFENIIIGATIESAIEFITRKDKLDVLALIKDRVEGNTGGKSIINMSKEELVDYIKETREEYKSEDLTALKRPELIKLAANK